MALLNIVGNNAPNTAPYNIFGLFSPGAIHFNGHMPTTSIIWNRNLTTFQSNFRCEEAGIRTRLFVGGRNTICADGGPSVGFSKSLQPSIWGVSTPEIVWGSTEMMWGFINTLPMAESIKDEKYNDLMKGYANYYDYLPDLPYITNQASSQLSAESYMGGKIWQTGVESVIVSAPYAQTCYGPNNVYTNVPYSGYPQYDTGAQWIQKVVPLRGVTKFPSKENAKNCIGFMQLETVQIGYGISYSWGISQDPNCLPKKSIAKCGGMSSGGLKDTSAPLAIPGFCVIDLDLFLDAFREEGVLNSVQDLTTIYNNLDLIILSSRVVHAQPAGSGSCYGTHYNIWQGFIDGWFAQPYKRIIERIATDSNYYINFLQTHYPQEANFHSILGCGRSFDAGVAMNSTICALTDCLSLFKAASLFPDLFPVDFEAYFKS